MWTAVALPFLLLSVVAQGQSKTPECFEEGQCVDSIYTGNFIVEDVQACLEACKGETDCNFFSYFESDNDCVAFANCANFTTDTCTNCYSGADTCENLQCGTQVQCDGTFIGGNIVSNSQACLDSCKEEESCEWFTFNTNGNSCILLETCPRQEDCPSCYTGQKLCSRITGAQDVFTKAIIIGGYANATYINDVYPIDLEIPSNNCQSLTDYPYSLDGLVATLYNGVLKACGGFAGYDFSDCYDYDFAQGVWFPAQFMQRTRSYSGASQIDGKWVVTGGGFPGTADTIEVWDGSSWSYGPVMPEEMMGHCQLTLNETHLFIANSDSATAYLLDWFNSEWTQLPSMNVEREYAGCGLALTSDNEQEVVIVGSGTSEIFNVNNQFWRPGPNPQRSAELYGSAQVGNSFIFVGGGDGLYESYDEVQGYRQDDVDFMYITALPTPTAAPAVVAVPNELVNCS